MLCTPPQGIEWGEAPCQHLFTSIGGSLYRRLIFRVQPSWYSQAGTALCLLSLSAFKRVDSILEDRIYSNFLSYFYGGNQVLRLMLDLTLYCCLLFQWSSCSKCLTTGDSPVESFNLHWDPTNLNSSLPETTSCHHRLLFVQ